MVLIWSRLLQMFFLSLSNLFVVSAYSESGTSPNESINVTSSESWAYSVTENNAVCWTECFFLCSLYYWKSAEWSDWSIINNWSFLWSFSVWELNPPQLFLVDLGVGSPLNSTLVGVACWFEHQVSLQHLLFYVGDSQYILKRTLLVVQCLKPFFPSIPFAFQCWCSLRVKIHSPKVSFQTFRYQAR